MSTQTPVLSPERLKEAREKAGLTQEQVAIELELSGKSAVSNFERGYAAPRHGKLMQLATLYGVPVDFFFLQN